MRPLLCLAVLTCVVGTAGRRPGADPSGRAGGSPSPSASSGSALAGPSPSVPCPSAEQFIKAMDAKDWTGFQVSGPIVCDGGWATSTVKLTTMAADPAHAVVRQVDGRWRGVTYGTDGLCTASGMRSAPAAVKKALGDYC